MPPCSFQMLTKDRVRYCGQINDNYMTMSQGVETFLKNLGLLQYYDMFLIKGFDSEDDIYHLDTTDLDAMLISDPGHRRSIINAAKQFSPSDEYKVLQWLRSHGLEHYFINFIQSELTSLNKISQQNLPDSHLYDELEITLPGHIRRLERAVSGLRKRQRTADREETSRELLDVGAERPLAYGRWAKPQCLQDAKFDFLVVDAAVCSTKNNNLSKTLEFMVDSGSDVTTIREEVLSGLDLELLGQIHSKGVHGSKITNLYKAVLCIGGEQLVTEVMGETYDSLGSRVVRHFKHFIDGSRHLWLKGDNSEPLRDPFPPPIRPSGSQSQEHTVPSLLSRDSSTSTYPATSSSYQSTSDLPTSDDSQRLDSQQSLMTFDSQPSQVNIDSQINDPFIETLQQDQDSNSDSHQQNEQEIYSQDTQIIDSESHVQDARSAHSDENEDTFELDESL